MIKFYSCLSADFENGYRHAAEYLYFAANSTFFKNGDNNNFSSFLGDSFYVKVS